MPLTEKHLRCLRETFQAELKKHWGHIGEIEARLSKSEGYLRKFSSGATGMPIELFLRSLEEMDVDPGTFFAKAFGTLPNPDDLLLEIEGGTLVQDSSWKKVEKAVHALETRSDTVVAFPGEGADPWMLVESLIDASTTEQRRRLRHTQRYRDPAFVEAYLERLDQLRADHVQMVCKLVITVIVDLLAQLPCSNRRVLRLAARALAVYASTQRAQGRTGVAARALHLAVGLARGLSDHEKLADLLLRGGYLLRESGKYDAAMILLRESLELYSERGDDFGVAKAHMERGFVFFEAGDPDRAEKVLLVALKGFQAHQDPPVQYLVSTCTFLARVVEEGGRIDEAQVWLEKAIKFAPSSNALMRAQLIWQCASLQAERRDYTRAEVWFRRAVGEFEKLSMPKYSAMASIRLIDALLALGKLEEAQTLAKQMAGILTLFRGDDLVEASILKLTRAALEASLSRKLVQEVGRRLAGESTSRERSGSAVNRLG